jgi:RNA polymerase sigma-70 factor (ECF subfamily)
MEEGPAAASDIDLELLRSGIRLMALRALGDPDAADEIAQETLARAVEVLRCPNKTTNLGAYVAGIARHVIADHFRAKERLVSIDRVDSETLRADGTDPLTALCYEGELARVRHALGELPDDDRELLRLCYFEGLTPTEVAGRMGVPPERIRQRKLRALQRLRIAFDGPARPRHAGGSAPTVNAGTTRDEEPGSAE